MQKESALLFVGSVDVTKPIINGLDRVFKLVELGTPKPAVTPDGQPKWLNTIAESDHHDHRHPPFDLYQRRTKRAPATLRMNSEGFHELAH